MTNSFSLSKTKQRSYEWRGNFAAAAITVIQDFWNSDPQYASAEDRANFVEWAIPSDDEEPSPFTWASVDEADSDHIVSICYFAHLFFFANIFLQIPGIQRFLPIIYRHRDLQRPYRFHFPSPIRHADQQCTFWCIIHGNDFRRPQVYHLLLLTYLLSVVG